MDIKRFQIYYLLKRNKFYIERNTVFYVAIDAPF